MFQFLGNPPFFTFSIFVVCIVVSLFRPDVRATCLRPASLHLSRILEYPFVHAGFFHLLLNMLAWMTMAKDLEHTIGTLPIAYSTFILLLPANALLQVCASFVLDAVFRTAFASNCSVGISGLLFSILVLNLRLSGLPHASFFGFFPIRTALYPYVLALLIQLILPGASILGHCAGIVSGTALANGWLRIVTPSDDKFDAIETRLNLIALPAWQPVPSMFGNLLENLADHLLPGRPGVTPPPSLRERAAAAWRQLSTWFSPAPNNASNTQQQQQQRSNANAQLNQSATRGGVYTPASAPAQQQDAPFSGAGYTLGGESSGAPTGRVPPTSRLLQLGGEVSDTDAGYGATETKHDGNNTAAAGSMR